MPGSSQKPESDKQAEAERFNETLKRMLKTRPKPHEKAAKDKPNQPAKKPTKSANQRFVDPDGSLLVTDEYSGYHHVSEHMLHTVVNHSVEYANGQTHTNTIEGFWALVKRAWYGSHHHYSKKYMPLYIAEACFKYNRRKADDAFADSLRMFVGAAA